MARTEKWEEFLEAECDGSGPHAMLAGNPPIAETRRLETGGGAGAFLCYACYCREIRWRRSINHARGCPQWADLSVNAVLVEHAAGVSNVE